MKAMILAAGRGKRMRPLTDTLPKPLLEVGGKPLIVWHIEKLVDAGITQIIINHAWQGHLIEQALGCGNTWGASLHYSAEPHRLETAGGIAKALPFFDQQPFLVINGDIWCDWDVQQAKQCACALKQEAALAWLLMVDNPCHNPAGDFSFPDLAAHPLTFAGIGVYRPELFSAIPKNTVYKLAPLLRQALTNNQVIATHYHGEWMDIGTPERLDRLHNKLVTQDQSGYTQA